MRSLAKKAPKVLKNSQRNVPMLRTSPGRSVAGRGRMNLCQAPKSRNNPVRVKKEKVHESGILPERSSNTAEVSAFNFGSSWKTRTAGLFQFASVKVRRAPSAR